MPIEIAIETSQIESRNQQRTSFESRRRESIQVSVSSSFPFSIVRTKMKFSPPFHHFDFLSLSVFFFPSSAPFSLLFKSTKWKTNFSRLDFLGVIQQFPSPPAIFSYYIIAKSSKIISQSLSMSSGLFSKLHAPVLFFFEKSFFFYFILIF